MIIEQKLKTMDINRIPAILTTGLSKQRTAKNKHPRLKVQPVTQLSIPDGVTKSPQLKVQSLGLQLQVQNSGSPVQAQISGITNKMGIQPVKFYTLRPGFSQSSRNNQANDCKEKTSLSRLLQSSSIAFSCQKP